MLNQTTINKLNDMRLRSMADSLREQMQTPSYASLSFEERFGLFIDAEWTRRKNNQLDRLNQESDLRYPNACIEDIEYHADRQLDQTQILRLSTANFIHEKHNCIFRIKVAINSGKSLPLNPENRCHPFRKVVATNSGK